VPRGGEARPDCARCTTTRLHFEAVTTLGVYRAQLQQAVLMSKQAFHEPLALTLGSLLADEVSARWPDYRPDLVLPIPMYWARRWLRGHSGPELIAEALCGRLTLTLRTDALACRRSLARQSSLPRAERFRNVRGAFRAQRAYDLRGTNLLLVDDTLTTGATASEAAKALKEAGAASVRVAAAARGIGE
jgi:ComF family protein